MRRTIPGFILMLAAGAWAAGCTIFDPDDDRREELQDAILTWTSQGIDRYEYTFQRTGCECLPEHTRPYVIRVDDDAVIDVIDAATGAPAPEWFDSFTIPELFHIVSEALNQNAFRLEVEYDPRLGYPSLISVDYDRQIADDELTIHAMALISLR